jgi:translation initiation factor IF-1
MERFDLVRVQGTVTACLKPSLIQVRLPNGHLVLCHLDAGSGEKFPVTPSDCLLGATVLIELRAFDPSSGRVLGVGSKQASGP